MTRRLYLLHIGFESESKDARPLVRLVCKDRDGGSVLLTVSDWHPYLYVRLGGRVRPSKEALEGVVGRGAVRSFEVVTRIDAVGFTDDAAERYAKVRLTRWPVWIRDPAAQALCFEKGIKPHLKFMCESGLRCGAWFDVAGDGPICDVRDLTPALDDATPPSLTVMAYDLETGGLDPAKTGIYQCCCVFWDTRNPLAPDPRSVVLCTQPTATVGDTRVEVVSSERALLCALRALIVRHDPDILTGFNLTFDNGFIQSRLKRFSGMEDYGRLGKPGLPAPSRFVTKTMKTAALGNNELVLWDLPGRIVIDLFLFSKANYPTLPNHKLQTCGETFVGAGKDDVPFGVILQSFADEAAVELRGTVAKYCLQDGYLCLRLLDRWSAHIAVLEVSFIFAFGQNMKCLCARLMRVLRQRARKAGVRGRLACSTRPDKKLMLVREDGRTVHFGQRGSHTFVEGASAAKRAAYRARHARIILRDGTRAVDRKYSPAHLSYVLLW